MFATYQRLNLHIGASNRAVIRAANRKLKKSARYAREHRDARHAVICPASEEAGKKTTCFDCGACGGHDSKAKASIVIIAHGAGKSHFARAAA